MPGPFPVRAGLLLLISALFAACESRPKTGLEWKEIALKDEGVSIQCPVDFSSSIPHVSEDGAFIFCRSAEADYSLFVEPWDKSGDEEEDPQSAFETSKNTIRPDSELISTDTVRRGDMMVRESVGIQTPAVKSGSALEKFFSTDPKILWLERAFVLGKRRYRMTASYRIPDRDSYASVLNNMREDREKFFASFHILREK